ncbi:LuxR C-terminal-related transcriptional regulator [Parapedomonas caeni]
MAEFLEQLIVRTKLTPPLGRRRLIQRTHLADAAGGQDRRPLTLVTAPAGYGKTSLLACWHAMAAEQGGVAAWVSLDPQDSHPGRFARHLIAAVQASRPAFGDILLRYLDTSANPDVIRIATALVHELAQSGEPVSLFLDDLHLIRQTPTEQLIERVLNANLANLQLVAATRYLPSMDLSRLRLDGMVRAVDSADLSFDYAETASFLRQVPDLSFDDAQVAQIHSRSEGWVAGLQLMVSALLGPRGAKDLSAALSGTFRDTADYLASAVLNNQHDEVRDFLLQTSILDRFNAGICAAVTGNPRSADILDQLDRASLFIVALDDDRQWFRYHHLFQDFLQGTLRRQHPGDVVALYRRASLACREAGEGADAVGYALLAGDRPMAAEIAQAHAEARILAGYIPETTRWLRSLPPELASERPGLGSLECLCWWHSFQQREATRVLAHTEHLLGRPERPLPTEHLASLLNELALHRAGIEVCASGDPARALALLDQVAPDRLTPFYQGVYHNVRGIAASELNRFDVATLAFRTASIVHRGCGSSLGVACAYFLHALMEIERGNLVQVADILAEARNEPSFRQPSARYIHPTMLETIRAVIDYERGDNAAARRLLEATLGLTLEVGHLKMACLAHITYARLQVSTGDWAGALATLDRLAGHLERNERGSLRALVLADYERIRLLLRLGRLDAADTLASRYGIELDGPAPAISAAWERLPCLAALAWARARLVRGDNRAAADLLDRLLSLAVHAGRRKRAVEIALLLAQARHRLGDADRALEHLRALVRLAQEQGMVRQVADEGDSVRALLHLAIETGALTPGEREFCSRVLALLTPADTASTAPGLPAAIRHDDFNARERQVLRLAASGRTNDDIAAELSLTAHTVKWHLRNIYRKLSVENRTAAVSAARALALI